MKCVHLFIFKLRRLPRIVLLNVMKRFGKIRPCVKMYPLCQQVAVDMEFAKNMYELHKRVSPTEVIIGWCVSWSHSEYWDWVGQKKFLPRWPLSSQVCHRLWHHRTLSAHPRVLQPWGHQPHSPDHGHSAAKRQDEHPRLCQVGWAHWHILCVSVMSYRWRVFLNALVFFHTVLRWVCPERQLVWCSPPWLSSMSTMTPRG